MPQATDRSPRRIESPTPAPPPAARSNKYARNLPAPRVLRNSRLPSPKAPFPIGDPQLTALIKFAFIGISHYPPAPPANVPKQYNQSYPPLSLSNGNFCVNCNSHPNQPHLPILNTCFRR